MKLDKVYKYTKDLNILYVEDDIALLEEVTIVFKNYFKNIKTASNGQEALKEYNNYFNKYNEYYDLVITDLYMPIMDGQTLIKKIHSIYEEQVVIVISTNNESTDLINLIQSGINNFILKPISLNQLSNILYKTCKNIYTQNEKIKLDIEKNIHIQKRLDQEEKIDAMAEMVDNIAHQWKQPLSIISTISSGMKLQKEFGMFDDNSFIENCDTITNTTQYLSKTLDNFRNSFDTDIKKTTFNLLKDILTFFDTKEYADNNITLVKNLDGKINLFGCPDKLIQSISNIINNAKDVLSKLQKNKKYIFIDTYKDKDGAVIIIKDNGGGIKEDILSKIFEAYFTTNHQSQGKGLGLYTAYNIITNQMGGNIEVANTQYRYNNTDYIGAKFTINIPLNKDDYYA